jgi:hypothetical protein
MIVGYVDLPAAMGCIFIPQPVFLKIIYENQYQIFVGKIISGCSVRGYTVLTPQELAINWQVFHKASRILHRIGSAYKLWRISCPPLGHVGKFCEL